MAITNTSAQPHTPHDYKPTRHTSHTYIYANYFQDLQYLALQHIPTQISHEPNTLVNAHSTVLLSPVRTVAVLTFYSSLHLLLCRR